MLRILNKKYSRGTRLLVFVGYKPCATLTWKRPRLKVSTGADGRLRYKEVKKEPAAQTRAKSNRHRGKLKPTYNQRTHGLGRCSKQAH